jgi:hypothetical protein
MYIGRGKSSIYAFGERVLRRILGLRSVEVMGGWRNGHNEELYGI